MDPTPDSGDLPLVPNEPTPTVPLRRVPSLTLPRPRRSPGSLVAAVLFHAALLGAILYSRWTELLTWEAILPGAAETPAGDQRGGGGGGGGIQVVVLPAWRAPASETTRPPVVETPPPAEPQPLIEPEPVPPVVTTADFVTDSARVSASPGIGGTGSGGGLGSGTGTGRGSGTGPGTGSGSGGGSPGEGSGARPPEPRQLILPPFDYPSGLRGRSIEVTFWVNADGRVERVALDPEIEDRGFQRKFIGVMRNYRFRPARSPEGKPIPGTTTITVTF